MAPATRKYGTYDSKWRLVRKSSNEVVTKTITKRQKTMFSFFLAEVSVFKPNNQYYNALPTYTQGVVVSVVTRQK